MYFFEIAKYFDFKIRKNHIINTHLLFIVLIFLLE